MKNTLLFIVCSSMTALGCSDYQDRQVFIDDATKYCDVHKVSYWGKSGKLEALERMNGIEKQQILAREIRSAVSTSEMQELIYVKGANVSPEEFYPYLQEVVPKLTGKPFDCPAIPEFYLPAAGEP
ncbi:MAG: hypothetical protein NVV73_07240 [Cellvibrionaceae bacterium]|nr:hypothetical protein [Cellvibrionaceae bacterium]